LYSLSDIYKIAVAYRLHLSGFSARVVSSAVSELFGDVIPNTSNQRAATAQDGRSLVIDFSLAPWILDEGKLPEEWRWQQSQEMELGQIRSSRRCLHFLD